MEFSRQQYRSGYSFPSPGDLPDPGIKPGSLALQADSLPSEPPGNFIYIYIHTHTHTYIMGGVDPAEVGGGGWDHEIWVILSLRQEFLLRISRESFVGVLEDEVRT